MEVIYTLSNISKEPLVCTGFRINPDATAEIRMLAIKPIQEQITCEKKPALLVLDVHEAEKVLGRSLDSSAVIARAAADLCTYGAQSVFIHGYGDSAWRHSFWLSPTHSFWLTQKYYPNINLCEMHRIFVTALAAVLALHYTPEDAVIIATMYTQRGLRKGKDHFVHGGFPEEEVDIPYLASTPLYKAPEPFKRAPHLGLYPIVDSALWVETLAQYGVKTIQLRIKEPHSSLAGEVRRAVAIAKKYKVTLYINDHWELALASGAQAVHLGQEDLDATNVQALRERGLLLGVSTYCYHEVARAHAISPSYIAIGPIYPTLSKELAIDAQGLERLHRWVRTLSYPLVAIGGISIARAAEVVATGVDGVALISAITQADDPQEATKELLRLII